MKAKSNYEAARHFNEADRSFVAAGKAPVAARAAPKTEADHQAMFAADQEAKDRAKEGVAAPAESNSPTHRRAGRGAGRHNADKRIR
jgi:hypothetical protein